MRHMLISLFRVKIIIFRSIYFFIVGSLLFAYDAHAIPISLKQAIETAIAKSPDIQQAENQVDSSASKKRLSLAPSEPTVSVGWNDMSKAFNLSTMASNSFQINQPLGFPGRALLNHAQLSDQEDALSYQLRALRLQISTNIKQAYYALSLAQTNIQLNEDTRLAFERILAIAKRRYEGGQTTQVDYLNAQVALLSNQNDLADLLSAERVARVQLNVLLKNDPETFLEIEAVKMNYHPKVEISEAISKMLESRNEIKSARSQATAADKAYKLAWMSALPDFQLFAGTSFYRIPSASPYSSTPEATATGSWPTHTYSFGIQFTVPLWFIFNEREMIVGASHDRAAAEANLDIVYNQSKIALETAVDVVNSYANKIDNFEKHLLPLVEQSFNIALVNYSAGKIDFQTLSDTATARRAQKQTYYQAVSNYLTNYASYGQLIGEDL